MRRILILSVALGLLVAGAHAITRNTTGPFSGGKEKGSWQLSITDTDIDASWELMAEADKGFTQLTASKRVVISNTGSDSIWATVTGVDSTNQRYKKHSAMIADGEKDTTDFAFYAIESFYADRESDAAIELIQSGGATLHTIAIGKLHEATALRTFGDKDEPAITSITYGIQSTTNVQFQCRVYPDIADVRDATDGYWVLGGTVEIDEAHGQKTINFGQPVRLGKKSVVEVWAKGAGANAIGWVVLQGIRDK